VIRIAVSRRQNFSNDAAFRAWLSSIFSTADGLYLREKDWDDATYALQARRLLQQIPEGKKPLLILPFRPAFVALADYAWVFQIGGAPENITRARQFVSDRYRLLYSAHALAEAQAAASLGADFIFLSPIFATPSKPQGKPLGLDTLRQAVESIATPIIALGGITPENQAGIGATAAFGLAGIRMFQVNA